MTSSTLRVALLGNPNTGKTTWFNRLTGLRQRTGNFPGVTVEKKTGHFDLPCHTVELLDLPGTYSLSARSPDEAVVVETLHGRFRDLPPPHAILCIADATNLQRHLFLVLQLIDHGLPLVLVLNMWDDAQRRGITLDPAHLSARLGCPVIPAVGTTGQGLPEIKAALARLADHPATAPASVIDWPQPVLHATEHIRQAAAHTARLDLTPAEARRLLFDPAPAPAAHLHWSPPHPP
ncbi:MAG TPA: FeoB small GTPase domain-containing protein, partial [Kiritimatiellia bacterium]|nr:FeoB small GTPase domain-containing protein [Kiritimatiellia bacterium]